MIDSANVGHKLLSKMGWKAGKGLGAKESGKVCSASHTVFFFPRPALHPISFAPGLHFKARLHARVVLRELIFCRLVS